MKAIKLISGLTLAIAIAGSAGAQARAKITCNPFAWAAPVTHENGIVAGTIQTSCAVESNNPDGIRAIEEFAHRNVSKDAKIHVGPVAKTFNGQPASYYDVTNYFQNDGERVDIRSDVYLGGDHKTKLYYNSFAKEVTNGTGNLGRLRSINIAYTVSKRADGKYIVTFAAQLWVKKPPFVSPNFVAKLVLDGFSRKLNESLQEIADNI